MNDLQHSSTHNNLEQEVRQNLRQFHIVFHNPTVAMTTAFTNRTSKSIQGGQCFREELANCTYTYKPNTRLVVPQTFSGIYWNWHPHAPGNLISHACSMSPEGNLVKKKEDLKHV